MGRGFGVRREDMKRRGDPGEVFDVQNMYQFVANSRLTGFRSRQDTPSRLHAFTPSRLHAFTPSHLHTFTPSHLHTFTPSHLHTFTPSHLHTFTPSHLHTFTPSHLHTFTPSHLHTFTPSHLHTFTPSHLHTFTPSHLHTFTPSHLHTFTPDASLMHFRPQTHRTEKGENRIYFNALSVSVSPLRLSLSTNQRRTQDTILPRPTHTVHSPLHYYRHRQTARKFELNVTEYCCCPKPMKETQRRKKAIRTPIPIRLSDRILRCMEKRGRSG